MIFQLRLKTALTFKMYETFPTFQKPVLFPEGVEGTDTSHVVTSQPFFDLLSL